MKLNPPDYGTNEHTIANDDCCSLKCKRCWTDVRSAANVKHTSISILCQMRQRIFKVGKARRIIQCPL